MSLATVGNTVHQFSDYFGSDMGPVEVPADASGIDLRDAPFKTAAEQATSRIAGVENVAPTAGRTALDSALRAGLYAHPIK